MKKTLALFAFALLLLPGCIVQQKGKEPENVLGSIVEIGDTVVVEYRGEFENGEVFDSSEMHGKPLEFVVGNGVVIKGFDEAVIGMRLSEEKTVSVPPAKGFGFRDESKVVEIPREQFTNWEELREGMPVHNNQTGVNGKLIELRENSAIVDFNHELAGKTLIFWIKVINIKKAQQA